MTRLTFDPSASGFCRDVALYLAHASRLAYGDDPGEEAREALGLEVETFRHEPSDTQGFVGLGPRFAVVAFRGNEQPNEDPREWLVDFRPLQARHDGYTGSVHSGISETLAAAWDVIVAALRRALADDPGVPLFVTGHSLGGALATLATCRLAAGPLPAVGGGAAVLINLRATYTFGAPRVGDPEFCRCDRPSFYRVVNDLDIVPLVPLEDAEAIFFRERLPPLAPQWIREVLGHADPTASYDDVGTLIHLDAEGRVTRGGSRPNWLAGYAQQSLSAVGRSIDDPVSDHLIGAYIAAL